MPCRTGSRSPVAQLSETVENSARAKVFWASLLLRPAGAFLRISGFCHHCGRKIDR